MNLIALTILAPLTAMVIILALRRVPAMLALLGISLSLVFSTTLLLDAFAGKSHSLILPGLPDMPLYLIATPLTSLLSAMVSVISSLVLVYATGYMKHDAEQSRFFATMLLFISAMQTLVLAGDWILLLAAWELIGLSSYLLIGFWFQRSGVKVAATRAFVSTRTADLGLYIAIFILIANSGTSEIATSLNTGGDAALVAGILLLIAAMGKSAQTPLHDWLQRAMAGPTPVSALLHSATLVAAGAILLIRVTPMLPADALLVIGVIGGITTIVTGLIAVSEKDLKRLLAASTSSQYGLMLLAIGAGVPMAALLHLLAHAAIKSSLFLGAGVFQHSRDSTSFSKLSGAGRERPGIFAGFALAALALAGIPPLSGFFSKDAIIAATLASPNAPLLLTFALIGTLLTGAYMARALHILWRGDKQQHDVAGIGWMGAAMSVLVSIAAVLGLAFPAIETLLGEQLTESTLAVTLGIGAAVAGLGIGWLVPLHHIPQKIQHWMNSGFAIAGGFNTLVVRPAFVLARWCEQFERVLYSSVLAIGRAGVSVGRFARMSDERGIDKSIFSLVDNTIELGQRARKLQSGLIHREMVIMLILTALISAALLLAVLAF